MFRSQSSDHHQGSITVLVQLQFIGVHASSYSSMWLYVVCAYDVPVRVVSGYVTVTIHNFGNRLTNRQWRDYDALSCCMLSSG